MEKRSRKPTLFTNIHHFKQTAYIAQARLENLLDEHEAVLKINDAYLKKHGCFDEDDPYSEAQIVIGHTGDWEIEILPPGHKKNPIKLD